MWLEDIANFVRSQNFRLVGQDVYIENQPYSDGFTVLFSPPFQGATLDKELTGLVRTSLQMTVRGKSPGELADLAQEIAEVLQCDETEIIGTYFKYIHQRYLPVVYPKTAGGYWESNVAFDLCFER